jgi:lipocalin
LRVSFPATGPLAGIGNFFQSLATGPNYQIRNVWVDANGNYQRALITAPTSRLIPDFLERPLQAIWILARTSSLTDAEIKETLDYARASGFDPDASQWERTEQVTCRSAIPRQ